MARINGSKIIQQGNEDDLQIAVAEEGPISVAVDASSSTFRVTLMLSLADKTRDSLPDSQFYEKGIYDSPNCSRLKVNHAMLLVGYGNITYLDYWIVKNRYFSPYT